MEEDVFYYIDAYGLWLLLLVAIAKLALPFFYNRNMEYAIKKYFTIYTDSRVVKEDAQRYNFRIIHNSLTWAMYVLILMWLMVWIIIYL
jgi:ABC-type uncharacterized transport system permease subunit